MSKRGDRTDEALDAWIYIVYIDVTKIHDYICFVILPCMNIANYILA